MNSVSEHQLRELLVHYGRSLFIAVTAAAVPAILASKCQMAAIW